MSEACLAPVASAFETQLTPTLSRTACALRGLTSTTLRIRGRQMSCSPMRSWRKLAGSTLVADPRYNITAVRNAALDESPGAVTKRWSVYNLHPYRGSPGVSPGSNDDVGCLGVH